MIQVSHLGYSLWNVGLELRKLATQLDIVVEEALHFCLKLLRLLLNYFECLAILTRNVRVELLERSREQFGDLVLDLHGHCLALSVAACPLLVLMVQVKVAEVTIFFLQAGPAVLDCLVHAREHLLELADDFERVPLDVVLVHGSLVLAGDALEFGELFIDDFCLANGDSLGERPDLLVRRLGQVFLFPVRGVLFAFLGVCGQKFTLAIHVFERPNDSILLVEVLL